MRRSPIGPVAALCLFVVALGTGCAVGPDYVPPESSLPDAWELELTRGLAEGEASLQRWWDVFEDPVLDDLIQRALAGNLTLEVAGARVEQARAGLGVAQGQWYPSGDVGASYARNRLSGELVPGIGGNTTNLYSVGIDASWEIDLFGRIRRSVESAGATFDATVEDYRDTLVVLLADVALNYVNARAFQQRIQYAESNVRVQRDSLQITEDRNAAGLVGDLDVRQAELNLASTEAFIPALRIALAASIHRLGVLVGDLPRSLEAQLREPAPIPATPPAVLVGVPADLLRQRPDVRSAERRLAAQTAQIGVAAADLYPRLALLGTFAFDATDASNLFTKNGRAFTVGPSLRWNIFDGGRIRANIDVQDAATEEAFSRYELSVLTALEETENAFVAYTEESERRDDLRRAATAAEQAVELVNTLYQVGLTDFQNVLDTERSLFLQQDELATSEGRVTQNLIRIYRALGGGWDAAPVPTQPVEATGEAAGEEPEAEESL